MFTLFISLFRRNMSSTAKKTKETLAKKLNGKRVLQKVEVPNKQKGVNKEEFKPKVLKAEVVETKSNASQIKGERRLTKTNNFKKHFNDIKEEPSTSAEAMNAIATEIKSTETLAKKLSGKRVPQKVDVPELFTEVKNNSKTKVASTKQKDVKKDLKRKVLKDEINETNSSIPKTGEAGWETKADNVKIHLNYIKEEPSTLSEIVISTSTKAITENVDNDVKVELFDTKWEPENWQQMLENIRQMRSLDKAPVDTMGCHKCADETADEKTQRFHKLVALMLSSQTKDETTYHAMLRLREHTLTPSVINEMKTNVLENILHPVSFYKNKAKYLQKTAQILIEKYDSDIPNNIKELVALPGVGPKMAHICMATAWNQTTGIGVDVHVHRISNRLQWLPRPTKEPEQTRVALENWLPRDLWREVNHLLVGFGQSICTPLRPKCSECLNCNICPAAPKTKKSSKEIKSSELSSICDKTKFKKLKMHL